jgi:hypothetical protein
MVQTTMIVALTIVRPQGCLSACRCPSCATVPTRTSRGSTFPPRCGMRAQTIPGGSMTPCTPSANCWMSRRSWCRGRISLTMTGGGRDKAGRHRRWRDVPRRRAETGGGGAPTANVVVVVVLPSVGARLLAAFRTSRRHLRTSYVVSICRCPCLSTSRGQRLWRRDGCRHP